jgi:hypothetical protein
LDVIRPVSINKVYRLVWKQDNGTYVYAAEDTTPYRTREGVETAKKYLPKVIDYANLLAEQVAKETKDDNDFDQEQRDTNLKDGSVRSGGTGQDDAPSGI